MRVGTLTSHFAINPGAVLQTYGLQKTIEELGHSVEVINFRHHPDFRLMLFLKGLIRNGLLTLRGTKADDLKSAARRSYVKFSDRWLHKTDEVNTFEQLSSIINRFDAIVVGSDQVWNARLWSKPPLVYFLTWCDNADIRRVSYAPCFGQRNQPISYIRTLPQLIRNFDYVSVRGRFNWEILKTHARRDAEIVVDPTLLCSFDDIRACASTDKRYVLIYSQSRQLAGEFRKLAEALKQTQALSVVSLSSNTVYPFADHYAIGAGPSEFVRLVSDADFILTTSYHGTIFALKYKKPFISFCRTSRSVRITDLLDMCGQMDRFVGSADEALKRCLLHRDIDYSNVDKRIDSAVAKSLSFLQIALG